jgi:type I restriction enzyme S subunit
MAGEWIDTTIGEQATLQRGIDITKAEQRSGTIPVISSGGVSSYHDTPAASGPGVILGRKGVVGSVYFVASDYWPHDTTLWIKDFHGNCHRFVYYFFKWMAPRIATMDVGSANPTLNRNHVHPIEIRWPPVSEQRAITHILGTLDDKIELNRRMNETLEEMVRALFKSWFVDFDPVRAKAEGRQPARMDVETAALFPDSFIESELGLLPKEWDIKPVREIIEDLFDGPHATPAEASEGAVYLGIKNLTGTQIDLTEIRYISELDWPQWTKRVVPRPHDIVFTYEATLGAFAIVPADLRCCLGRRLALVRPKTGQLDYCFLFHTFVSKAFQELLMARANQGSTVNRIPLIDFPQYPVIWPARQLIDRFHRLAEPLWSRIHRNQSEARNLVAIRDMLLPQLISGALRVRDAERFIGRTV